MLFKLKILKSKLFLAGIILLGLVLNFAAYHAGRSASAQAGVQLRERMERIWPHFLSLTSDEKIAIVMSAERCNLVSLDLNSAASELVSCLRAGADIYEQSHPASGIKQRLELLLTHAQAK
jgi:hypothetical protein